MLFSHTNMIPLISLIPLEPRAQRKFNYFIRFWGRVRVTTTAAEVKFSEIYVFWLEKDAQPRDGQCHSTHPVRPHKSSSKKRTKNVFVFVKTAVAVAQADLKKN